MSNLPKTFFTCACGKKTSTTNPARAAAKVCVHCRPDLDAAPAKNRTAKVKATPAPRSKTKGVAPISASAPAIERVPGTLADARRAIGPDADFEGMRAEGYAVMYLYEEPAAPPVRVFSMAMAKRRLTAPQFQMKFGSLLRKGKLAGTRVTEIPLDPNAPENVAAADAPINEPASEPADATATAATVIKAVPVPVVGKDTPATAVPSKRKKPSALDAAALVLREAGAALSPKDVWQEIVRRHLWTSPKGRTPHATVAAAMLREWKALGDQSRFLKTGERGKFAANPGVA